MIGLRPEHHVHIGRAAQDFLALGLGDAAGDRDQRPARAAQIAPGLQVLEAPEIGIDFLRRLLADVAGVEDDEIRVRRGIGPLETEGREDVRHPSRVVDVHLAPVAFDEQLLCQGRIRS